MRPGVRDRGRYSASASQRSAGIWTDSVHAIAHQLPEARRIVAATGYATAKTDDRDGFARRLLYARQTRLRVFERQECPLQRRQRR